MSFGFSQEINIESAFRNGPWLFPGTAHSCDAVHLWETLMVVQSLQTNLYQVVGKGVPIMCIYMLLMIRLIVETTV